MNPGGKLFEARSPLTVNFSILHQKSDSMCLILLGCEIHQLFLTASTHLITESLALRLNDAWNLHFGAMSFLLKLGVAHHFELFSVFLQPGCWTAK